MSERNWDEVDDRSREEDKWQERVDALEARIAAMDAAIRVLLEACEESAGCCGDGEHGLGEAIKAGEAVLPEAESTPLTWLSAAIFAIEALPTQGAAAGDV